MYLKKLKPLKPDSILGLVSKFNKDNKINKINLTVGELFFHTIDKSYLFDYNFIMKKLNITSDKYLSNSSKYLPIVGLDKFIKSSENFIFGNNKNRVGIQTLSGTGSLTIGNYLLSLIDTTIYIPKNSWPNHFNIFNNYKTFSKINDLLEIPNKSTILFHTCCNNPTGIDYTKNEWNKILKIMIKKNHIGYFDSAYLGLSSGDINIDTKPIRDFENNKIPIIVSTSYAKNFGLYGQRIGSLFFNFFDKDNELIYLQYLKKYIRKIYSNPPRAGAEMAHYLMDNKNLLQKWNKLLKIIINQQSEIRIKLYNELNWNILNNNGLFFICPLSKKQIITLREQYGIYLLENGRINISALNNKNIHYFIKCVKKIN